MRALAKTAVGALVALGVALALFVVVVAAIGVVGTRSATAQGNEIADDELTTAVVTGQLARNMDAAYADGQEAAEATVPAERSRFLGTLYAHLLPAVDGRLFALDQLHAADPPAEHADIALVARQWAVVRNLLGPAHLSAPSASASAVRADSALTARLGAAYVPVSAHLDRLFQRERDDALADHALAGTRAARTIWTIAGAAGTVPAP